MATIANQAGSAIATDPGTGLTNMVWSQDGVVYAAYYDPACDRWVDASIVPGSSAGQDLQLGGNVTLEGTDGALSSGLIATWVDGSGNDATVYASVGQSSPLGGYQWSSPVPTALDAMRHVNPRVTVTADGRLQSAAGEPLTADDQRIVYGGDRVIDFVRGSNLPAATSHYLVDGAVSELPLGVYSTAYNFDLGVKFSSNNVPVIGQLPLIGGKKTSMELEVRLRGGYQQQDTNVTGGYAEVASLRAELKLAFKMFDMVTIAGYLQGQFQFGGVDGDIFTPIQFIGGRLTEGLQGRIEYVPPSFNGIVGEGDQKYGGQLGFTFDVRLQQNNVWKAPPPPADGEPAASSVTDFAQLVRADGSPALMGDDPAQLHWIIDPSVLADLILGSLGAAPLDAAPQDASPQASMALASVPLDYSSQLQLSPGIGGFGKVVFGSFLEAKATLTIFVDFLKKDAGPFDYNNVRARFDAEARTGVVTYRFRAEWSISTSEDGDSPVHQFTDVSYRPLPNSGAILTPESILGAEGAVNVPYSLATAEDGTLLMAWVQDAPNDSGDLTYVAVSQSKDNGQTWSTPQILGNSAGLNLDPVAAFDSQGRGVVVWNNGDGSLLAEKPPGHAYVVFGSADLGAVGSLDLADLNGSNGFVVAGGSVLSAIGAAAASAGDLNHDGVADFVVGAPSADIDTGKTFVVFGKAGLGASGSVDIAELDGTTGFVVEGLSYGQVGTSVHSAGDVNGDGIDDLVIGAPGAGSEISDGSMTGAGAGYVIFGQAGGFGANGVVNVSTLNGTTGFRIESGVRYDGVGTTVGGGADLNGDGRADLVLGAPGVNGGAGAYYVVFGQPGLGSSGKVDLSTLDGTDGFVITYSPASPAGQPSAVPLGEAASLARDLNGDGIADLILGSEGQAFLVFGARGLGASGELDLYQPGLTKVVTIDGRELNGFAALAVGDAGDVDGDGFNDLIVGVPAIEVDGTPRAGSSYVVFGGSTLPDRGSVLLQDLDGSNGFAVLGAGDTVSSAGDVNQDGFADLLIGDPSAAVGDQAVAGKSYLVFGSATLGAGGSVDLASLPAGQVLQLDGGASDEASGSAVSGIGDVNGDGIPDLIIGAPQTVNQGDFDEAVAGSQVKYSVLQGGVWTDAAILPGIAKGAKGASSLQQLPDGKLLLTWVSAAADDPTSQEIHATFWNNGWGTPQVIASGHVSTADPPRISQVNGQTTIAWTEIIPDPANSNNDQFRLYSSTYDGTIWSAPTEATIEDAVVPTDVYADNQSLNLAQAGGGITSITVAGAVVGEKNGWAEVVVSRHGDLSGALTLRYATMDGSATGGADYEIADGSVSFAAGEREQIVRIRINDDADPERRIETFQLRLWSTDTDAWVSQGTLRLDRPSELRATVEVIDDEPTQLAAIGSGFIMKSEATEGVGRAVVGVGDVNRDGFDDFMIGAPGGADGAGKVYLVYGSSNIGTGDAGVHLDTLNGQNGAILIGTQAKGQIGTALASGDFNRDGKIELVIGMPQNPVDPDAGPGKVYVLSADKVVGQATLEVNATTAKELYTSAEHSLAGASLAVGDINGDGTQDLVIGAPGINRVFVVYGQTLAGTGSVNLGQLTSSQGFLLIDGEGRPGSSVTVVDLDGDGIDDILMGAPTSNPVAPESDPENVRGYGGQVYVVFGNSTIGKSGPVDLSTLNGTNGLRLVGQHSISASDAEINPDLAYADSAGASLGRAFDVNGDGRDDVIVGAPGLTADGTPSIGGAYVLFSGSSWRSTGGTFQLTNVNGTDGFIANGVPAGSAAAGGTAGAAVSGAGDLNGDGIGDLLVGIPTLDTQGDNSNTGQTAVLFGTRNWTPFLDSNHSIDLSDIPLDSRVFAFNGTVTGGNTGVATGNAGDVNGDGLPDLLIGAPTSGEVYISFGRQWMGPGGSMDVAKLRSDNGFVYSFSTATNELAALRGGGDLNGDGYRDLLVAEAAASGGSRTRFDIIFGSDPQVGATPLPALSVDTTGWGPLKGQQSVGFGDFNGDGIVDLVIGVGLPTAEGSQANNAVIVFGTADNSLWSANDAGPVTLTDLMQTHGGVQVLNGAFLEKQAMVAGVDVNGDGYDDLAVSAGEAGPSVAFPYVIFGRDWAVGTQSKVNTSNALNGTSGFSFQSASFQVDWEGRAPTWINGVGDLNGDGYQDLGLTLQVKGVNAGFIVFGGRDVGSSGEINLDTLNGSDGFRIVGSTSNDFPHRAISAAGDINGDGYDDFIVSEADLSMEKPSAYAVVVFGKAQVGAGGSISLTDILSKSAPGQGFYFTSSTSPSNLGYAISSAGDVNGDAFADLMVTAPAADGTRGLTYVLFGSKTIGASGSINVDGLNGQNGFIAVGAQNNSYAGFSVTGPGDLNGDGFDDLGIGARGSSNDAIPGRVFAAFGGDFTGATTYAGTAGDDVLQATEKATTANPHIMNGRQGNDILESVGSEPTSPDAVVMLGGGGNDTLAIGSLLFGWLDGGTGNDTLMLNPYLLNYNNLDLTLPDVGGRIQGIETIDLGCLNRVTLRLVDLLALSDTTDTWTILGVNSKVVVPTDEAWVKAAAPVERDGVVYDKYTYLGATILLEQGNDFVKDPFGQQLHDDAYVVVSGSLIASVTIGVLANDVRVDVAATVTLVAGPSHGTLQLAADGSFSYTAAAGFHGIDSFAYRVTDGSGAVADAEASIHSVPTVDGMAATLDLVSLTAEQQIASIYTAMFGRGADADGFAFWVGEYADGLATQGPAKLLADIASAFATSAEAQGKYPFLATADTASDSQIGAFLASVYGNLFNRTPDEAGQAYWIGAVKQALADGRYVGSVLVNIMSGAQNSDAGADITTLMGKVAVSLHYVEQQREHDMVWTGPSDLIAARSLLQAVNDDPYMILMGIKQAEAQVEAHA